ncbi:hypothetical protein G9A89_023119 [Geosiphon pyriformis]|nr:hypothetical protein G9A89_023119 [Geosiphon pyriformis]
MVRRYPHLAAVRGEWENKAEEFGVQRIGRSEVYKRPNFRTVMDKDDNGAEFHFASA